MSAHFALVLGLFFYPINHPSLAASVIDNIPPYQDEILDETQSLKTEEITDLKQEIDQLRNEKNVWMAIYFAKQINGEDFQDFAHQVFVKWKLGDKDKNNGLLFIAVPSLHKMRLEVGYGLEATLTDGWTRQLQDETIAPAFRERYYNLGLSQAIQQIGQKVSGKQVSLGRTVLPTHADEKQSLSHSATFEGELDSFPATAKIIISLGILFAVFVIFSLRGQILNAVYQLIFISLFGSVAAAVGLSSGILRVVFILSFVIGYFIWRWGKRKFGWKAWQSRSVTSSSGTFFSSGSSSDGGDSTGGSSSGGGDSGGGGSSSDW